MFISTCSQSCNWMLHKVALACHSLAQLVICVSCVPVHSCISAHSSPEGNCVRTARPACGEGNITQTRIRSTRSCIQRLGRYILLVIDRHVTLLPCWLFAFQKLTNLSMSSWVGKCLDSMCHGLLVSLNSDDVSASRGQPLIRRNLK